MKTAVVFIHGFNKKSEYWNKNEFNKDINIEKIISKKTQTLLVQIDDYSINPKTIVTSIINQMKEFGQKKWIIVCHSLGVIYGLEILNHDIQIGGLCIIDPSTPNDKFIEKITSEGRVEMAEHSKNAQYGKPSKTIFHIHFDYDVNKPQRLTKQIKFFSQFTSANDKSKIIIHPNKGHMIHYTDTPKIISSILTMISYLQA